MGSASSVLPLPPPRSCLSESSSPVRISSLPRKRRLWMRLHRYARRARAAGYQRRKECETTDTVEVQAPAEAHGARPAKEHPHADVDDGRVGDGVPGDEEERGGGSSLWGWVVERNPRPPIAIPPPTGPKAKSFLYPDSAATPHSPPHARYSGFLRVPTKPREQHHSEQKHAHNVYAAQGVARWWWRVVGSTPEPEAHHAQEAEACRETQQRGGCEVAVGTRAESKMADVYSPPASPRRLRPPHRRPRPRPTLRWKRIAGAPPIVPALRPLRSLSQSRTRASSAAAAAAVAAGGGYRERRVVDVGMLHRITRRTWSAWADACSPQYSSHAAGNAPSSIVCITGGAITMGSRCAVEAVEGHGGW